MKLPFRREKNVDTVPEEIQEYYQSERRERTGIAWLLALGALLVTIVLAILLFFGGRWIYRTVFDKDDSSDNPQTAQEEGSQAGTPGSGDQTPSSQTPGQSSTSSTNTDTTPPTTTPTPTGAGSGSDVAGSQTTTVPAAGDLPDTGAGDIVAVFAATTLAAASGHYVLSRRQTK